LWVKRCAETESDPSEFEELGPECASEYWVTIADYGTGKPMEADNGVEECLSDRDGSVWVAKGNEVCILGEPVDDGEDDRFATNTRKPLNEIHGDVCPNCTGNFQGLQQSCRV
jgi:hypothetical protein